MADFILAMDQGTTSCRSIIFNKNVLLEIGKLAVQNKFFVISDEAYEDIVFNKELIY